MAKSVYERKYSLHCDNNDVKKYVTVSTALG
jgi:hypothetical protein